MSHLNQHSKLVLIKLGSPCRQIVEFFCQWECCYTVLTFHQCSNCWGLGFNRYGFCQEGPINIKLEIMGTIPTLVSPQIEYCLRLIWNNFVVVWLPGPSVFLESRARPGCSISDTARSPSCSSSSPCHIRSKVGTLRWSLPNRSTLNSARIPDRSPCYHLHCPFCFYCESDRCLRRQIYSKILEYRKNVLKCTISE